MATLTPFRPIKLPTFEGSAFEDPKVADALHGTFTDLVQQLNLLLNRREKVWREAFLAPVRSLVHAQSPFTVKGDDFHVLCDCTGGAITVKLPPVVQSRGMMLTIQKTDAGANVLTVTPALATEAIGSGGAGVSATPAAFTPLRIVSDGVTHWALW